MSRYRVFRTKKDWFSFIYDPKSIIIFSLLLIGLLILFLFSAALGEIFVHPVDVLKLFIGEGTEMHALIVNSFRMPRILTAIFVGIGLAVSGAILQGMIRNPLASPDIIGITGGAGVAVVAFLAMFSNKDNALTVSIQWMPFASFLGALAVGFMVYVLAYKNGIAPMTLILIGIGISALAQALTTMFMIMGPIFRASQANIWLTGSVYGANWLEVKILIPIILVLLFFSLLVARRINAQELGEETAAGIGAHLQRDRLIFLTLCTAMTGVAVAFAGGIGFVGLMAPHIARRLAGSSYGALIPVSALIGAILVLGADLIGRTMFSPLEVPAGVFTATIGAPYFIFLLYRSKRS
ncbi:FecCD family ABC transporter permease [Thalassobacillus pellis]|uniref:FecCD family ABC transporter permease n=1 Tax=Thalassobacillus pellis TaxID=748008 RepID=UPI0019610176|nr:iron ABC transporter permease [Thalassobacillus pellis]MBM7551964.1 iron complex transport system permease protein [Thalassobacillus pellis]